MQKPRYVVLWITEIELDGNETSVDIFDIFHDIIAMHNSTSNKSSCQVYKIFPLPSTLSSQPRKANLFDFFRLLDKKVIKHLFVGLTPSPFKPLF